MKNIDLIAESVEIIEKNLKNNFTVRSIARKLGYSYFHFSRLFKGVTGHAPSDYIVRRRLSEAAAELIQSRKKVIEIAYDYQFNSPEAFSRAFKRMFSLTPLEMRRQKELNFYQTLDRLNPETIYHTTEITNYPPEEVELDSFIVAGMSCLMTGKEPLITRIWENFFPEFRQIPNRVQPERYYQICFWPETGNLGGIFLMAGVQVQSPELHHPAFVLKTIPAGRYLKFIHKGLACKVGLTYKYIYQTCLPHTEYRLPGAFNFEFYGEKCRGPNNPASESEIYIPVG